MGFTTGTTNTGVCAGLVNGFYHWDGTNTGVCAGLVNGFYHWDGTNTGVCAGLVNGFYHWDHEYWCVRWFGEWVLPLGPRILVCALVW